MNIRNNNNNKNTSIDLTIIALIFAFFSSIGFVFIQYYEYYKFVCPTKEKISIIPDIKRKINNFKYEIVPYQEKRIVYYKGVIIELDKKMLHKQKNINELINEIKKLITEGKDIRNKLIELKYEQKTYLKNLDSAVNKTKINTFYIQKKSNQKIDSLKNKITIYKNELKKYSNKLINLKKYCDE